MSDFTDTPQFGERAEFNEGDRCYRHPDRETFTLCHRCGNNICTDCQVSSPVGLLCPDCAKQSRARFARNRPSAAKRLKNTFGDGSQPTVTYSIMVINILVFGGQMLFSALTHLLWYAPLYSHPERFEPWRMVTAMFTHSSGNIFHILFNMFALWLFGRNLEMTLGKLNFLFLYLMSGIGGALAVMLWGYTSFDAFLTPTVGASGAIFGVLGATLVYMSQARANITSLVVLIGINVAIGFYPGMNISWQAHLGGLAAGGFTMWILTQYRGPRFKKQRIITVSITVVVFVLLSLSYFFLDPVQLLS